MLTKESAGQNRKWFLIDASDIVLGRLATFSANLLRGKNKKDFTVNQDCGDYLIVINTDKIILTGKKEKTEKWYNYSGYKGGLRTRTGKVMKQEYSDELVRRAISRMLPNNKLSNKIITKLFVYKNNQHKHEAQNPQQISVEL